MGSAMGVARTIVQIQIAVVAAAVAVVVVVVVVAIEGVVTALALVN